MKISVSLSISNRVLKQEEIKEMTGKSVSLSISNRVLKLRLTSITGTMRVSLSISNRVLKPHHNYTNSICV